MFSMLQYDIPKRSGFGNPSGRLRRLAIRTSLSVWIVRDDHVPHHLIADMTAAGCTVRLLPFASQAAEQTLAVCTEELRREVERVTAALARSLALAGDKLEAGRVSAVRCAAACRAALRRAEKALAAARAVETLFGIDAAADSGLAAVEAIHLAAVERAAAYVALAARVEPVDAGMAEAARADDVPAEILADRLEDDGQDASDARRVLAAPTPPEPAGAEIDAARTAAARDFPAYRNPHPAGTFLAGVYERAWDALNLIPGESAAEVAEADAEYERVYGAA